ILPARNPVMGVVREKHDTAAQRWNLDSPTRKGGESDWNELSASADGTARESVHASRLCKRRIEQSERVVTL
ncbi:MAG TPA: hypothetical protein VN682_10570, partial [Terriglobales bacterium]|nr:hypothetical protein [Terriglobales bacterium]